MWCLTRTRPTEPVAGTDSLRSGEHDQQAGSPADLHDGAGGFLVDYDDSSLTRQ